MEVYDTLEENNLPNDTLDQNFKLHSLSPVLFRRNSVKDLIRNFENNTSEQFPGVVLRPKNQYQIKRISKRSKLRWSIPYKENCDESAESDDNDDITGSYVRRIEIETNKENVEQQCDRSCSDHGDENKENNSSSIDCAHHDESAASIECKHKSLVLIAPNLVKQRVDQFSKLCDTTNPSFFNNLRTCLSRGSSMLSVTQSDISDASSLSEFSDIDEMLEDEDGKSKAEENSNVVSLRGKFENGDEKALTNKNFDTHEKLVEFYRSAFESISEFPFTFACIYCSIFFTTQIMSAIVNFVP